MLESRVTNLEEENRVLRGGSHQGTNSKKICLEALNEVRRHRQMVSISRIEGGLLDKRRIKMNRNPEKRELT